MTDSFCSKQCEHCGAYWINGEHYWSTGKKNPDSELDLAGLVCNTHYGNPEKCINPKAGMEGGQTWAQRESEIDFLFKRMNGDDQ